MNDILNWIINNKEAVSGFVIALYELIVRIKPTAKDWSFINNFKRIIDIIPNNKSNATDGQLHK
jgi:hypothetical protein